MFLLLLKRIIPPPSPAICVEGKDKSERRINGELWLTFCICTRQKTRTHAQTQETMDASSTAINDRECTKAFKRPGTRDNMNGS